MLELIPTEKLQWYTDIFYQKICSDDVTESLLEDIGELTHLFEDGTVFRSSTQTNIVNTDIKITQEIVLDEFMHMEDVSTVYKKLENHVINFFCNILSSDHPSVDFLKSMNLYNGTYRFKHYTKGVGKYDWHLDMGGDCSKRIMTVLFYLNNVKEGGQTEFSNQDCYISCQSGTMCAFPPFWNYPHRSVDNLSDDKNILALFIEKV